MSNLILITSVSAPGSYDGCFDCDYAVAGVDEIEGTVTSLRAEIESISSRVPNFNVLEVFDYHPVILSRATVEELFGETALDTCDNDGYAVVDEPKKAELLSNAADLYKSVECLTMRMDSYGFRWAFYPKHTEVECSTAHVGPEILE